MNRRPPSADRRSRRFAAALLIGCALAATVIGQTPASRPVDSATLAGRQQSIQERLTRLEATMLKLSKLLALQEPEKAERMLAALEHSGKHRLRSRAEILVKMLRSQQFSALDREQESLVGDLESLLTVLTSQEDELARRRAERQRLEKLKREIRMLLEDQTQNLYHTQHAEQELDREQESGQKPGEALAEKMRQIEQSQRQLQQRAEQVGKQMRPKPGSQEPPTPGAEPMEQAADEMRQSADRLGERKPADARRNEQRAADKIQQALDELDDALRQTRKEEIEQTLEALQSRLQQLLAQELEVRGALDSWLSKPPESRTPEDDVSLAEASKTQTAALESARATHALVVDEGSTVIVPELLAQAIGDMQRVESLLAAKTVDAATRQIVEDVVNLLQELLGAIEQKQEQDRKQQDQDQPAQQQDQQSLLPKSAELKMLRSSQARLNARTPAEDAAAGDAEAAAALAELGQRQRRLSELARRMYERD